MMGPFKCTECGVWWVGLEHRCQPLPVSDGTAWVVRPYSPPTQSGGTTSTPWCSICEGWHIPGAGPCTASYSAVQA